MMVDLLSGPAERCVVESKILAKWAIRAVYRVGVLALLLFQCVWSGLHEPTTFYMMYTNWSLFLLTVHFGGVTVWSLATTVARWQPQWLHRGLTVTSVIATDAHLTVLLGYWGAGANDIGVNPGLMILNHTWTFLAAHLELALSGTPLRLIHVLFWLPFHLAWSVVVLPIAHLQGYTPYQLPDVINYRASPGSTVGLVIGSVLVVCPLIHILNMLVQQGFGRCLGLPTHSLYSSLTLTCKRSCNCCKNMLGISANR